MKWLFCLPARWPPPFNHFMIDKPGWLVMVVWPPAQEQNKLTSFHFHPTNSNKDIQSLFFSSRAAGRATQLKRSSWMNKAECWGARGAAAHNPAIEEERERKQIQFNKCRNCFVEWIVCLSINEEEKKRKEKEKLPQAITKSNWAEWTNKEMKWIYLWMKRTAGWPAKSSSAPQTTTNSHQFH